MHAVLLWFFVKICAKCNVMSVDIKKKRRKSRWNTYKIGKRHQISIKPKLKKENKTHLNQNISICKQNKGYFLSPNSLSKQMPIRKSYQSHWCRGGDNMKSKFSSFEEKFPPRRHSEQMLHLGRSRHDEKSLKAEQEIKKSLKITASKASAEFGTDHLRLGNDKDFIFVTLNSTLLKNVDDFGFCVGAVEPSRQVGDN